MQEQVAFQQLNNKVEQTFKQNQEQNKQIEETMKNKIGEEGLKER